MTIEKRDAGGRLFFSKEGDVACVGATLGGIHVRCMGVRSVAPYNIGPLA